MPGEEERGQPKEGGRKEGDVRGQEERARLEERRVREWSYQMEMRSFERERRGETPKQSSRIWEEKYWVTGAKKGLL